MGVELLLLYFALTLVLGPGVMLYGAVIIVRQRVRLSRAKVLNGGTAIIAGIAITLVGAAFTRFLWEMARFFPH
jgi:hypothetical protein